MPLILVIEDEPTQRMLTQSVLSSAGHEVIVAADGEQGLAIAWQMRPHLIVCDVVMPGINGYQFIEAVKSKPELSNTPIILLTAMGGRAHVRIGMTAGADDYIPKPFTALELRDAVATLLAKRHRQRERDVGEMKGELIAAMDEQKQSLALQYERRLVIELNERWTYDRELNGEVQYPHATVLVANLFVSLSGRQLADEPGGAVVRRLFQSARDSLYLFGARHLLPLGGDLLAVFAADGRAEPQHGQMAMRAAFALQKAVRAASGEAGSHEPITIALHCGPVTLLQVNDPLHGGESSTIAAGATVQDAVSLRQSGLAAGWLVIGSAAVVEGLGPDAVTGRQTVVAPTGGRPALQAVELLPLA